jgi:hypothetical protein
MVIEISQECKNLQWFMTRGGWRVAERELKTRIASMLGDGLEGYAEECIICRHPYSRPDILMQPPLTVQFGLAQ